MLTTTTTTDSDPFAYLPDPTTLPTRCDALNARLAWECIADKRKADAGLVAEAFNRLTAIAAGWGIVARKSRYDADVLVELQRQGDAFDRLVHRADALIRDKIMPTVDLGGPAKLSLAWRDPNDAEGSMIEATAMLLDWIKRGDLLCVECLNRAFPALSCVVLAVEQAHKDLGLVMPGSIYEWLVKPTSLIAGDADGRYAHYETAGVTVDSASTPYERGFAVERHLTMIMGRLLVARSRRIILAEKEIDEPAPKLANVAQQVEPAKLTKTERAVLAQYVSACHELHDEDLADEAAFKHLQDNETIDAYTTFDAWRRRLSDARRKCRKPKRAPRAGRSGRSIVRADQR